MRRYFRRVSNALRDTYRWKRPITQTKSGQASPLLWFAAAAVFTVRLFWISQCLEFLYRCRKAPAADIPPRSLRLTSSHRLPWSWRLVSART